VKVNLKGLAKQEDEASVLIMKEVSWNSKLQFVKDVPMVHVNFIVVIVVTVERKGITFVQRSCTFEMLLL